MRIRLLVQVAVIFLFFSCASYEKTFDRAALNKNDEFDKLIQVERPAPTPEPQAAAEGPANYVETVPAKKAAEKDLQVVSPALPKVAKVKPPLEVKKTKEVSKPAEKPAQPAKPTRRQPEIEDDEGFSGRRPLVNPFRVGEEVVLGISYFGVEAGKFTMRVEPMVKINGQSAYHFKYLIKTSPLFNMVYRVDDVAETFVDAETLLPYSYEIHVDESKQARETRTLFDHKKNKAIMWDRKQKIGGALEKKKIDWDLQEYSQNVFSAAYYLRNFQLKVGKLLKVHVGHEGKNILMTAEVIRREKIYTDVGALDTFVVKPSFDVDGKFKPTGENFLWLTADDRKFIVRMESKIKIGTIVGKVQKIKGK